MKKEQKITFILLGIYLIILTWIILLKTQFSVSFVIIGETLQSDERRKSVGYSPFDEPIRTGGEGMLTVTVQKY